MQGFWVVFGALPRPRGAGGSSTANVWDSPADYGSADPGFAPEAASPPAARGRTLVAAASNTSI